VELKHPLTPHLKSLRLSGILETLDTRNRQAIEGQWSYVEFLSRLLEDEVERRAQKVNGPICSATHCWPRPGWIAYCTGPKCSSFVASASALKVANDWNRRCYRTKTQPFGVLEVSRTFIGCSA
jgi:hypothetical protein